MNALGNIKMNVYAILKTNTLFLAFVWVVVRNEDACEYCHEEDTT